MERDAVLPIKIQRDDRTTHTAIHNPRQWEDVADRFFGEKRKADKLRDLAAAESLHAHVFITDSKELIELREHRRWSVPIVTSLEALPLLWSWLRGFGDFWDGHTVTSADFYYWALGRALTPNANAGFGALVFGEYALPSGHDLMNLALGSRPRFELSIAWSEFGSYRRTTTRSTH